MLIIWKKRKPRQWAERWRCWATAHSLPQIWTRETGLWTVWYKGNPSKEKPCPRTYQGGDIELVKHVLGLFGYQSSKDVEGEKVQAILGTIRQKVGA